MQKERKPLNSTEEEEQTRGMVLAGWECSLGDWKCNEAISRLEALKLFSVHKLKHKSGTARLEPVKVPKNVKEINLNRKVPYTKSKTPR